jgi:hypothetical protein
LSQANRTALAIGPSLVRHPALRRRAKYLSFDEPALCRIAWEGNGARYLDEGRAVRARTCAKNRRGADAVDAAQAAPQSVTIFQVPSGSKLFIASTTFGVVSPRSFS